MLTILAQLNQDLEESTQDLKESEQDIEATKQEIRDTKRHLKKLHQNVRVLKKKLGQEQVEELEVEAGPKKLPADSKKLPAESRKLPAVQRQEDLNLQDAESILYSPSWFRLWLRDACKCPLCVDPSTKQKLFETSQIPDSISYKTMERADAGTKLSVTWESDIPGFGPEHTSTYDMSELAMYDKDPEAVEGLRSGQEEAYVRWNKDQISGRVQFIDYQESMTDDTALLKVLQQLQLYGLVFIKNVPGENGPAEMGKRMGRLRDTFYGATWDVKSVPQAKNIAYTHQFLGFHMDLLYMADPPGFQLLHCIKNSCEGGASMFMDSFHAVNELASAKDKEPFMALRNFETQYHYKNAGEHYRHSHATVVYEKSTGSDVLKCVNYSPPFQAPFVVQNGLTNNPRMKDLYQFKSALAKFQAITEDEKNIYEYKMKEGEMVIFNNRRVLHARRAFDINSGERWLKGAYIDTDVIQSKLRVLREKYPDQKPETGLQE